MRSFRATSSSGPPIEPTRPKPRSIERIGEEFLAIVWEDGHESFYEAPFLRGRCPCADCRTRREDPNPLKLAAPRSGYAPPYIAGVDEVGNYAVRIRWGDGHASGIYDFALLRSLCPCDLCAVP